MIYVLNRRYDLAEYFNITFAQAKRIVYVKKGKKNDS